MTQLVKTQIDGVPVELEIIKMGPATATEINKLENSIASENKSDQTQDQENQETQIKITKIGDASSPTSDEDIDKVKKALNGKDPATLIQDLASSIESVPAGKDWWKSKVVIANAIAILTAIFAYFNVDFKIDPELFATVFPIIMALINLYFRKGTNVPLSNNVLPKITVKK